MKRLNLVGQNFGKLLVLSKGNTTSDRHRQWNCICDCGNKTCVTSQKLKSGHTKSCGCLKFERFKGIGSYFKHGHSKKSNRSGIYLSWRSMINRCSNPKHPHYHDYADRGISICDRWKHNFMSFLEDMGDRPKGLTLHRIDNNLGYYKENCKWATHKEQNQKENRRLRTKKPNYADSLAHGLSKR